MRLINKLNIYFLISLLVILVAGTYVQYLYVSARVDKRVQKTLIKEKKLLVKQILDKEKVEGFKLYKTEESEVQLSEEQSVLKNEFIKQFFFDEDEDEYVKYMVLKCRVKANNHFYDMVIKKPLLQANDLISSIIYSLFIILLILFAIYMLLNRFVYKKLLAPFYTTLEKLRKYDLEAGEKISFSEKSSTYEFNFLNAELNDMTSKIYKYFDNHKMFSENAAHELQTPLSVIKSKAELLLQARNFEDDDIENIDTILSSVDRISRINSSLVILSKIENHDFSLDTEIPLNPLFKVSLNHLNVIAEDRGINIDFVENDKFNLKINEEWAYILVNNLLKNAVRHNIENGWIKITINKDSFVVENSGFELDDKPTNYFKRFIKGSKTGSTGLGLAIIKDICTKTNLDVEYTSIRKEHRISITKLD